MAKAIFAAIAERRARFAYVHHHATDRAHEFRRDSAWITLWPLWASEWGAYHYSIYCDLITYHCDLRRVPRCTLVAFLSFCTDLIPRYRYFRGIAGIPSGYNPGLPVVLLYVSVDLYPPSADPYPRS